MLETANNEVVDPVCVTDWSPDPGSEYWLANKATLSLARPV